LLRKLFKDSFTYSVSTFLSMGIGLFMIPFYTRILTPKDYGFIELLAIFGMVVSVFLNLEIYQAVARFYPDALSADDKKKIVSTSFWFIIASFALFNILVLFIFPKLSVVVLKDPGHSRIFLIGVWAFTFNFIFSFLQRQLIWQLLSRKNAIASITYTLLVAGFTITFLYVFKMGVIGVFLGQLIAAAVGSMLAFIFARESYAFVIDVDVFTRLVRFSLPLVPASLAVYGILYVDRYIINYFLSLNEVGLYSVAYKLASVITLMTVGVQTALTPMIYNYYQKPETPQNIALLFRYFFLAGMITITAISVFSRDLMVIFTQPAYYQAARLVPCLLFSVFFTSILNFSPGIFIEKRTKLIVYINVFLFLSNVVLNTLFVSIWGVQGAALATMLCSLLYFGLYQVIGNKFYPIPYPWPALVAVFACSSAGIMLVYFSRFDGLWLKAGTVCIASIVMSALLTRSRDWRYCYQLVRGGGS